MYYLSGHPVEAGGQNCYRRVDTSGSTLFAMSESPFSHEAGQMLMNDIWDLKNKLTLYLIAILVVCSNRRLLDFLPLLASHQIW